VCRGGDEGASRTALFFLVLPLVGYSTTAACISATDTKLQLRFVFVPSSSTISPYSSPNFSVHSHFSSCRTTGHTGTVRKRKPITAQVGFSLFMSLS